MSNFDIADTPSPTSGDRAQFVRSAFRLEAFTIAWMLIEAAVAVAAGVAARSLLLLAFGMDSIIELISACVLVWRLLVELRQGRQFSENVERHASRIAGGLLFGLAAYVIVAAAWGLWRHHQAAFSMPGLALSVATIPVMYLLSKHKLILANKLESRSLRADAFEGIACGWFSFVVVLGLMVQLVFAAWWADPAASLCIVYFLVKEGYEAWEGEECSNQCHASGK